MKLVVIKLWVQNKDLGATSQTLATKSYRLQNDEGRIGPFRANFSPDLKCFS